MATGLVEMMRLDGRVAVVTGGANGIGRATCRRLAEAGAAVLVADLDGEGAAREADAITGAGGRADAVAADVADPAAVAAMVAAARARLGGLDVLVNNAGIFPARPIMEMEPEDCDRVLDVNLRGLYLCTRAAARVMAAAGRGGVIVNITSIDAIHPSMPGLAHYDASKHGAWGFTKTSALELAPLGIRVNALAPGGVLTEGVRRMQPGGAGADAVAAFTAGIPLRRMGDPDEIARMVVVLASDLAAYMTGSQVVVDGGALLG